MLPLRGTQPRAGQQHGQNSTLLGVQHADDFGAVTACLLQLDEAGTAAYSSAKDALLIQMLNKDKRREIASKMLKPFTEDGFQQIDASLELLIAMAIQMGPPLLAFYIARCAGGE